MINYHVDHSREYLNFTDWNSLTPEQKTSAGLAIARVVESGEMPLASYVLLHSDADLTETQKQQIIDWARNL